MIPRVLRVLVLPSLPLVFLLPYPGIVDCPALLAIQAWRLPRIL